MAVVCDSRESDINVEVGIYQQFPKPGPEEVATERTPKPRRRHVSVVLLSFALLCVLQGTLNISLRLALSERAKDDADKGETETETESCPQGWLMFGSSCYYVSYQRRSWDGSRQDCLQRDADLVIIDNREEQAFLTSFTVAAWVGMTDREKEGTWVWVDGTLVDKDRLQWAPGQPDEAYGGEDCGDLRRMDHFVGLNDFNCSGANQWICEKTLW